MRPIIIGTAGHIDHGKTALIRALTGRETDRLEEEQRRGITIDLGFTWMDLENGMRAGVIDVPGHEKFIRNMTAGASGMDLVLLVIAADEGIMPQTREHIDILSELGIKNGMIVLNKCDLVDTDWLELTEQEIREELKGSCWETSPLVRVSAVTHAGVTQLKEQIEQMAEEITEKLDAMLDLEERTREGSFRLFVDRVFSKEGFGTVATGTVIDGCIRKGEELEVYPSRELCRVRNLQAYERNVEICQNGERAACNLSGLKKEAVHRGVVLAKPGSLQVSRFFSVKLHVLPGAERLLENRCRLHLYCGTTEVLCRAVLLDRDMMAPGEYAYAQFLLEEDAAFVQGDRFVVRFYSPLETIGGGEILHVDQKKRKRFREDVLKELDIWENGSVTERLELMLATSITLGETSKSLADQMRMDEEKTENVLSMLLENGNVLRFGNLFCHKKRAMRLEEKINDCLEKSYEERPFRRGVSLSEVRTLFFSKLRDTVLSEREAKQAWGAYLTYLEQVSDYRVEYGSLAKDSHNIQNNAVFLKCRDIFEQSLEKTGFQFSKSPVELLKESLEKEWRKSEPSNTAIEEIRDDFLNYLEEEGRIVKLGEEIYIRKCDLDKAVVWIEEQVLEHGKITIVEVRDHFGCGRKHAKMIFDYTDQIKLTRKDGAESERVRGR